MLKAYKTNGTRRALRVTLVSDFLDARTLKKHCNELDCVTLSPEIYISLFRSSRHPLVNIDEYFNYAELMDINLAIDSKARKESFAVLLEILETKYGIEYVEAEK